MSTPFTVRLCRRTDLDRILEVETASFGPDAYDRNLFADFFDICRKSFLVVSRRSQVCGYMITCVRGDRAEIVSIAVEPSVRGRGAASTLMDSTLRRLKRRKVARLVLMVRVSNAPARAFYMKYGFEKTRVVRKYYEDGTDGLLMALRL